MTVRRRSWQTKQEVHRTRTNKMKQRSPLAIPHKSKISAPHGTRERSDFTYNFAVASHSVDGNWAPVLQFGVDDLAPLRREEASEVALCAHECSVHVGRMDIDFCGGGRREGKRQERNAPRDGGLSASESH